MKLNAHFPLGWLRAGFVEVEDQTTARKPKRVALLEQIKECPRLLGGRFKHESVASAPLEIELEERPELSSLE